MCLISNSVTKKKGQRKESQNKMIFKELKTLCTPTPTFFCVKKFNREIISLVNVFFLLGCNTSLLN